MLKDLIVIDPERSHNEEDTSKSLVLYHEFGESTGCSLNDKMNKIGIVQGIWSLTKSFGDNSGDGNENEEVIELDDEVILVIKVESRFFICVTVSEYMTDESHVSKNNIPYEFYMGHIWLSYRFFLLIHGKFSMFNDINKLTDNLNEHMITFWNDIYLKPETLIRQGINVLWPHSFKVSELADDLDLDSHEDSWQSIINKNILLQEESYLGIKDILIYHLPPLIDNVSSDTKIVKGKEKDKLSGAKNFGLLHSFSHNFESLPDISNWVYHLFSKYDNLSSHVLAGTTHYKEAPTVETSNTDTTTDHTNDYNIHNESNNTNPAQQSLSTKIFHNLALPVSFAYDAVQEVGSTTGVSSSMSFFKDYIPFWPFSNPSSQNGMNHTNEVKNSRYGYLVSPTSPSSLPMQYKILKLHLSFGSQTKIHNTLFWYYDNMLAVIICDESFERIWDAEYLNDINFILSVSMNKLHTSLKSIQDVPIQNFAYTIIEKQSLAPQIRSSIPSCFNILNSSDDKSPLELVIDGFDQLFTRTNSNIDSNDHMEYGIDIMGSLFKGNKTEDVATLKKRCIPYNNNFLDKMEPDRLWELQREILIFLNSLYYSVTKNGIGEERLLTLNNGVLCYLKVDNDKIIIILKNWFDKSYEGLKEASKEPTLFAQLGIDVMNWWDKLNKKNNN